MGRLSYGMLVSLDGYVRDATGDFDWTEPDEELHEHFNDIQARTAIDVYGRHMWEAMSYWQDPPASDIERPAYRGFAEAWQDSDVVVVSRTLGSVDWPRATLWPELDLDRLRALVETAAGDVSISGPSLAAAALQAGLVDEVRSYVVPHVAGGGLRFLPEGWSVPLHLRSERRFADGTVELVHDVGRG